MREQNNMRTVDTKLLQRGAPLFLLLALGAVHCSSDDSTTGGAAGSAGASGGNAGSATGGSPGTGGTAGATGGTAGTGGTTGSGGSAGTKDSGSDAPSDAGPGLEKLNHVIVIYMENWSFDSLYGEFAGAEGLSSAAAMAAPKQVDVNGVAYTTLPQVEPALGGGDAGATDPDGGALMFPNAPFALNPYFGTD